MSKYKDQIFQYLSGIDLKHEKILSIGAQEEDKRYFKSVECDEFMTLDSDNQFRPNIQYDLNIPIVDPSGDMLIGDQYGDHFDCILMLNVWEYIWNPFAAHDNLHFFLKSGGTLITNYPFVYPQHEPKGTDYMRYAPDGIDKLLFETGFEVIEKKPIYGNDGLVQFYMADGMKARAGAEHNITGMIVKARKI